ncbi:glycosyltransferase family 2 protein [Deinococcus apachensis]|uniref:glycosyltransferase family 2 protein n=1 Tax=Deinococcus apachensis TaxID=309886 RepID=UPI00038251F3|nr:glycosyltransferase family 2 protein [Deinococcus apachensis]
MNPRISVVINTLNEEHNLPLALDSVCRWVDDIVVVDMHSNDRTATVARAYGARVFLYERLGYADPARAFALAQATGDWVLVLDADEVVPAALAAQLHAIARRGDFDAADLPYQNFVGGVAVRGLGWGPTQDHHVRFFRQGQMRVTGEVHNFFHPLPGTRVLRLPYQGDNALLHFSYTDYTSVMEKINRYTGIEAQTKQGQGVRPSLLRETALPVREFLLTFLVKRGYRDGRHGLRLAVLLALYKYLREIKLDERVQRGTREDMLNRYRQLARQAIHPKDPL